MSVDRTAEPKPGGRLPAISVLLAALALAIIAAVLIAPAAMPTLMRFEHSMADWRTTFFSYRPGRQHPQIAIVTIDDETLAPFRYRTPIDRELLASLVRAVDAAGASAIGLDVFFIRPTEPEKDAALKAAIREARAPVVMGAFDERGEFPAQGLAFQAGFIADAGRSAGYLNLRYERDGVVRYRALPAPGSAYRASFSLLLARTEDPAASFGNERIAWTLKPRDADGPFLRVRAQDLLNPQKSLGGDLKGRIVIIGGWFPYTDRHRTPFSAWSNEMMAGAEVHAHALAELLDKRRVVELTPERGRLMLAAVAAIGGVLGWRYRHRRFDFLGWSIASSLLIAIDALVFSQFGVILPFILIMLAWFAGVMGGHHIGHIVDSRDIARERSS